jgi:uncharacterized iron-regulated membrane protein
VTTARAAQPADTGALPTARGRPHRSAGSDFRRSPLRRAVFQVHLWLGVLLGLYTVVSGLTGSALVFRTQIDRALAPSLFAVSASTQTRAPLAPVLAQVARSYPGETIEGIDQLQSSARLQSRAQPAIVYLNAPKGEQRMLYFDPSTGRILGSAMRYAGFLGVCANLHYYLLAGQTGYILNGICACAFLLLCCTGWVLWWPGRAGIRRGLRVHWRARWKRLNWDLHAVGGFWTNPLLIAVIATGILFVFPKPVLEGLALLSGAKPAIASNWLSAPTAPTHGLVTIKPPNITPDEALAQANAVLHRYASTDTIHYLALPSRQDPVYDAIAYPPNGADYALPTYIYLDAATAQLLACKDARDLPRLLQWATYAYAVHFGTFGGVWTRALWVLLGILPAGLWATGLLLWWNRGLKPRFGQKTNLPPHASRNAE